MLKRTTIVLDKSDTSGVSIFKGPINLNAAGNWIF